jgi:Lrp/AsnC family leucine-responsive transcriptional regulator
MASKSRAKRAVAFRNVSPALDVINRKILHELLEDPRMSTKELARRIGMSAPATNERVQRMEKMGLIRGVRLDLDRAALGLPVTAYVRVRPMPGMLTKVADLAKATPEVIECHRITGEDCFIMKVVVAQIDGLEAVLDDLLEYGNTTTSIVQSSPVEPRAPPLPPAIEKRRRA